MDQILNSIVIGCLALAGHVLVIWLKRRSRRGPPIMTDIFSALSMPLYCVIWIIAAAAAAEVWVEDAILDGWLYKFRLVAVVIAAVAFLIRLQSRVEVRMRESIPFEGMRDESARPAGWGRIVAFTVLIIGSLVALQVLGINVSSVIAFGGFGAVAVGIAGRELFANLFGGRMLYLTRSFIEGDKIQMPKEKLEGTVNRIGWYQTTLLLEGETPVTIPNAHFMSQVVINASRSKWSERHMILCLSKLKANEISVLVEKLSSVVDQVELLEVSHDLTRMRLTEKVKKRKPRSATATLVAVREVAGSQLVSLAFE